MTKLGVYSVGGVRYLSKTLAYQESLKRTLPITFDFSDDIFDQLNWLKEPEPNIGLGEFYRRRAQALRDKYDYIVLQYSGGPDSQNVLHTFLENNIKLDEVVNFNSYDKTRVVDGTTHNADYVYNVIPGISEIHHQGAGTRITVLDEIDMTEKVFSDYSNKDYYELLFTSGTFPSVWMMRGIWTKYVPHIWDLICSGKKVCILLGTDKTPLAIQGGRYCTKFSDVIGSDPTHLSQNSADLNGLELVEFFYHTPDDPFLVVKQAHTLKNYVESLTDESFFENTAYYTISKARPASWCASKKFPGMNLRYEHYHRMVYPSWRSGIVTHKPIFYGNRHVDCWWVSGLSDKAKLVWTNGITKYLRTYSELIGRNAGHMTALPIIYSKLRFLE